MAGLPRILVTGAAGFIGFHLCRLLLSRGHEVVGFDGMTPYYDPTLKQDRLRLLEEHEGFVFVPGMLEDAALLAETMARHTPAVVVHLAAQPGVRYSIERPDTYIQSNIVGTANLLEVLRRQRPRHLVFASTSSVYGLNEKMPFAETDRADAPVSLYAATKKAGEELVHAYSHLWDIPATCLRFFTVYGPYGRPDMAPIKFARAIETGKPIDVYGYGRMRRDFTFVDDLVRAIAALIAVPPAKGQPVEGDSLSPVAPFRVVNIGGGRPVELMDFIAAIERALGRKAGLNMLPMQPGDVVATEADTQLLQTLVGELPTTSLDEGMRQFVAWFRRYNVEERAG